MARTGRQTPTQSVILPFKNSKGTEAVALYEQSSRKAQDWQKLLIEDIMAQGEDGLWTHASFGYEVPRQNGKGEVLTMREMWGLVNGENICHTAHKTSTSHSAFIRLEKLLTASGYVELGRKKKGQQIPEKSFKSTKQYGLEQILMTNGGTIVFRTRTEAGGIGESFDLLVIDEAQEYTVSQQSALIYTIAASRNPQTIFCGTPPTLTSKGSVFTGLRKKVISGRSEDAGWAEWSLYAIPDDIMDPELWAETNPSLGTILQERTIRNEDADNRLDFIIQRLGYWHTYELKSEITEADWNALKVSKLPDLKGKLFIGIKFGADGQNVAMSLAVRTGTDRIFLECLGCQPQSSGFGWILNFLAQANVETAVIDGKGKTDILLQMLKDQGITVKTIVPETAEAITAYSGFRQAVDDGTICHAGQPSVVQAVANCEKRLIGSNGAFGFRSIKDGVEVAIVESMALARWQCSITKERKKAKIWY